MCLQCVNLQLRLKDAEKRISEALAVLNPAVDMMSYREYMVTRKAIGVLAPGAQAPRGRWVPASEHCRATHEQNCHACENVECGDNMTPGVVALKKKADELASLKREVLRLDQPWGLISVLEELKFAADTLLHEHNYDRHGHENINQAIAASREIVGAVATHAEAARGDKR